MADPGSKLCVPPKKGLSSICVQVMIEIYVAFNVSLFPKGPIMEGSFAAR